MRGWATWAMLGVVGVASSCSPSPRPNLLLVTFDTTRWDHVGFQTGRSGLTPMLDALATRGTVFETCITSQPLTLPAHTTLLTGLYPYHHGVRNNGTYHLAAEQTTLAERLKAQGYATHAVVSAFVLDSQFGLDQGFDSYDDDLSGGPKQQMFMFKETRADQTTQRAASWLKEGWDRQKPFFMWVHYFDPHADYDPPAAMAARYPGNPYQGEIAFADQELGRLIKVLDDDGLLKDTVLAFTSDHGDGLGDHGEKTHGIFLYESTTRVPLLLAGPGVPQGKRVGGVASLADIVPTVLELLNVGPGPGLDGRSLRELWEGKGKPREAYSETIMPRLSFGWSELRSLRGEGTKTVKAPTPEIYDLRQDPMEQLNLASVPGAPAAGQAAMIRLEKLAADDPLDKQTQSPLTGEMRQKLEALGYVTATTGTRSGPLPDPKSRIQYWEQFQAAQALMRRREPKAAIAAIEALLQADPDNLIARGSLAGALVQVGEHEKGLAVYEEMIHRSPESENAWLGAAGVLRKLGRFEEAARHSLEVQRRQPENPEGYVSLGDTLLEQGKFAEAEPQYRAALAKDGHSSLAVSGLSNCLNREGRHREAAALLEAFWAKDQTSYTVAYNLAVVRERLKDDKGALAMYKAAIRLEPDQGLAWNNLGSLLDRNGKREDALRAVRKAVEVDEQNVEALFNLGSLLLAQGKAAEGLPWLEAALKGKPTFVQAAVRRAQALTALKRGEEAMAAWRALTPVVAQAYLPLAKLMLEKGDRGGAEAVVAEALAKGDPRLTAMIRKDSALSKLEKK